MEIEELVVEVNQLKLGMYVSRLDRPWLDSPFFFQGFPLNDIELIKQLQECCEYVIIDVRKTSEFVPRAIMARTAANATTITEIKTRKKSPRIITVSWH